MKSTNVLLASGVVAFLFAFACGAPSAPEEKQGSAGQHLEVACEHPICAVGASLTSGCDPCTTVLCAADPYCCTTSWDATCVGEVGSICGQSCTAPPPPPPDAAPSACSHSTCAAGDPLVSGCDPCSGSVCAVDPYCCTTSWDATCVGEAISICSLTCN